MWNYLKEFGDRLLSYPRLMFMGLWSYLCLCFYMTLALFDHSFVIEPPEEFIETIDMEEDQ